MANEDLEKLRTYAAGEGFEFPILIDEGGETIQAWGLLNDRDPKGRVIPHPTVVVLDRERVVRFIDTQTDYRVRPPVEDLLEALRAEAASTGE